jgi:dihydrofolate reductase
VECDRHRRRHAGQSAPSEETNRQGHPLYGSGSLVDALVDNDLIDELRLWIIPVVVGTGKRLFGDRTDMKSWKLVGTTPFRSGAVVLAYVPTKSPAKAS